MATAPAATRTSILVVEDDAVIRKALRQILVGLRYDVDFSPTMTGAIAALVRSPTHLVLDPLLPDGSGLTVLRRVQELELPVRSIVMTAVHDLQMLERARQLGAEQVFVKPVPVTELVRWIHRDPPLKLAAPSLAA